MFLIQTDEKGSRLVRDSYHDGDESFIRYHSEGNKMIAIYKYESNMNKDPSILYTLWNFDSLTHVLYHDLIIDMSPKEFQEWTKLAPTPENIKKYNVKPKLLKYIFNKKLAPSNIFMTKTKWVFNCQSMSYLKYKVKRSIYIFFDMLASMG